MAGPNYTLIPHDWANLEHIIDDLSSRIIDEDASFSDYILKDGSRAFTSTGDGFKDEDDMASDSAVAVASQQSVKAYVDSSISDVLSGLSANLLVATDGDTELDSVSDLTAWIAGTENQITVTDDTDGTVTLSTPQDSHTGASPEYVGLTLSGLTANRIPLITTGGQLTDSAFLTYESNNHIRVNGIICAEGTAGDLPLSGAGTRFFWYPSKTALRAGIVTGTDWDASNIGTYTVSFGGDNCVQGTFNYVFGHECDTGTGAAYNLLVGTTNEAIENYCSLLGNTLYSGNVYNLISGYAITSGGDYQFSFGRSFTPLASDDNFCLGWGQLDYSFTATAANFYNSSLTINSVEVIGADGEVNAAAIEDKFLRNDASDSTSGTITAAGFTTAGTVQAEQLTSTDDITMQGHLLTMGDAGQAVDTVLSFLGSTNSATITYDESANALFSTAYILDLTSNGEVRGKAFVNSGDSTNQIAFQANGIALIHKNINGFYLQGQLKQPILDINVNKSDLDFSISTTGYSDLFFVDAGNDTVEIGDGSNYSQFSSTGVISFGGTGGLRLPRFTDDVSNPPTDAELDAAIGAPSAVGEGYVAIVDDNDAGANVYLVVSTGTDADKWWIATLTQAA